MRKFLAIGILLCLVVLISGCTSSSGDATYDKYSQMSASDLKTQANYVYGQDFLRNPDNYRINLLTWLSL